MICYFLRLFSAAYAKYNVTFVNLFIELLLDWNSANCYSTNNRGIFNYSQLTLIVVSMMFSQARKSHRVDFIEMRCESTRLNGAISERQLTTVFSYAFSPQSLAFIITFTRILSAQKYTRCNPPMRAKVIYICGFDFTRKCHSVFAERLYLII